ncbi:MAG: hypothetical protein GX174_11365 [Lentisphaerae bacterium]|jgi:sodium pump decarboxylase gamma subunit|nr:hypothetical protein [Lentisphaerota bacterium]
MLLTQGLVLMVVGVSIVWLFLGVLVLVLKVSARIVPRFNHILPDNRPAEPVPMQAPAAAAPPSHDEAAAVAIAVAVAAAEARRGSGCEE